MDLLGSILSSMEKPPTTVIKKEELLAKKQQEKLKKIQEEEKEKLRKFRKTIEDKVKSFVQNDQQTKLVLEQMDKVHRSIVHDVAEVAGLTAYSFGIEDVDRHTIIYKKEAVPPEEELNALRKGEEYDPEKIRIMKEMERQERSDKRQDKVEPTTNYQDKYERLIGKDAGMSAAKITTPNQQFGFVPSANKRDLRSIEQIMADNRKKKQKVNEDSEETS